MFKKVELYFKRIILGKNRGVIAFFIKLLLLPLSWLFKGIVLLRNWLYDNAWVRRYVPPVSLVISVGNIVAGGTGKTPMTLLLANAFYGKYSLAILSRGYRSKINRMDTPVFLSEGKGPIYPASYCGDEPFMLAQRLPALNVIVGGDRQQAARLAAKAGVQVIILDDGMQHRQLARDFDIAVVDINDPFGQGYHLPRGFLREGVHSLARADLIVLNYIQNSEQFLNLKGKLSANTKASFIGTQSYVAGIKNLKGETLTPLKDKKVGMFCGIAHPDRFKKTLEDEGAQVLTELWLPDHDKPKDKVLQKFAQESIEKGCELLVCTEKDWVKLTNPPSFEIPIVWVQMELKVVEGLDEWDIFIKKAKSKIF
jgi:tetraacyldisaccharide 4'-kinase